MPEPIVIPNIRMITVSGRIAAGSTTLAKNLSNKLNWKHMEGGEIFWAAIRKETGLAEKDTNLRPDQKDLLFEKHQKELLESGKDIVLESKLSGFVANGIEGIFKILVICEDDGSDQPQIRIDRLLNREGISTESAREEVLVREKNDIEKWRRLYGNGDPNWVYWDKKYYDLVINTFSHNQDEAFAQALEALKIS